MAMRPRPLADGRPNAPRDGFQAEPVFVAGEDLDRPLRMFRGFLRNGVFEVLLNAAASRLLVSKPSSADYGFELGAPAEISMTANPFPLSPSLRRRATTTFRTEWKIEDAIYEERSRLGARGQADDRRGPRCGSGEAVAPTTMIARRCCHGRDHAVHGQD
ncbi:MAG: hypothetical protein C3F11_22495 [Methylocystaceae bacterium]|nr:MAG: hypothetical protein C3F11_22495 [Methylocystaceae bacterium]